VGLFSRPDPVAGGEREFEGRSGREGRKGRGGVIFKCQASSTVAVVEFIAKRRGAPLSAVTGAFEPSKKGVGQERAWGCSGERATDKTGVVPFSNFQEQPMTDCIQKLK
jgi:hypothetical protein